MENLLIGPSTEGVRLTLTSGHNALIGTIVDIATIVSGTAAAVALFLTILDRNAARKPVLRLALNSEQHLVISNEATTARALSTELNLRPLMLFRGSEKKPFWVASEPNRFSMRDLYVRIGILKAGENWTLKDATLTRFVSGIFVTEPGGPEVDSLTDSNGDYLLVALAAIHCRADTHRPPSPERYLIEVRGRHFLWAHIDSVNLQEHYASRLWRLPATFSLADLGPTELANRHDTSNSGDGS